MLLDPALARLIAILRETPGRLVPYQRLINRMWPEAKNYPPAHARHHLRELIYRARSACENEMGEVGIIATLPGHGYAWTWHGDLVVEEAATRYRRLATSDVAQIRTLRLAGQSISQIAGEIGTSKAVVNYWTKKLDLREAASLPSSPHALLNPRAGHEPRGASASGRRSRRDVPGDGASDQRDEVTLIMDRLTLAKLRSRSISLLAHARQLRDEAGMARARSAKRREQSARARTSSQESRRFVEAVLSRHPLQYGTPS